MSKSKKALSSIIVTVLFVVIALAAIAIFYNFYNSSVSSSSKGSQDRFSELVGVFENASRNSSSSGTYTPSGTAEYLVDNSGNGITTLAGGTFVIYQVPAFRQFFAAGNKFGIPITSEQYSSYLSGNGNPIAVDPTESYAFVGCPPSNGSTCLLAMDCDTYIGDGAAAGSDPFNNAIFLHNHCQQNNLCANVTCAPLCVGNTLYSNGACNATALNCEYTQSQNCPNGCSNGACLPSINQSSGDCSSLSQNVRQNISGFYSPSYYDYEANLTDTNPTATFFINGNHTFELISASATSATIRVTNLEDGYSESKEISEGKKKMINGIQVYVGSVSASNFAYSANIQLPDRKIVLKEGNRVYRGNYVVVPTSSGGKILQATTITNQTTGVANDKVDLTNVFDSSERYTATLTSEGHGSINIDGNVFNLAYYGLPGSGDMMYLTLDFPQSTGSTKMTFYNCASTNQTTCIDECTSAGAWSCQNYSGFTYASICGNGDSDSCLEWVGMNRCEQNQCQNGACSNQTNQTSCTNDCSYFGQKDCNGGTYIKNCGNYDSDSCLEWNYYYQFCEFGCSGSLCLNQSQQTQTGGISMTSNPSVASTYIDGIFKGYTPITVTNLTVGFHNVQVKKSGYQDYIVDPYVYAGQTTTGSAILVQINQTNQTSCTNDCSYSGQKSCYSTYLTNCGYYDADSCLDWNYYYQYCSNGCSNGACIPAGNQTGNGTG